MQPVPRHYDLSIAPRAAFSLGLAIRGEDWKYVVLQLPFMAETLSVQAQDTPVSRPNRDAIRAEFKELVAALLAFDRCLARSAMHRMLKAARMDV